MSSVNGYNCNVVGMPKKGSAIAVIRENTSTAIKSSLPNLDWVKKKFQNKTIVTSLVVLHNSTRLK